jgi:Raf kinase inhibitor-like YbhB/YbcL family protein
MSGQLRIRRVLRALIPIAIGSLSLAGVAQSREHDFPLKLTSATFANDSVLPLSTIHTMLNANGLNTCTADGAPGGNESPQLSWSHVPEDTRSFAVVMYDVTASFTHWGMYNIPASTTSLPANAGALQSSFAPQITNDLGDMSYDGPCPPPNRAPTVHQYVITVYALDTQLHVPAHGDFPAKAEELYHALLDAGRRDHILATASITGLFSSAPAAHP